MKNPLTPELLHELCHDLRGPLGAIGTWVPVLKSERADGDTRTRALNAMSGDVRAMGLLLDQVSTLAETLSGGTHVSLQHIDLVPFVKSACFSLTEGGRELACRATEASLFAVADPVRLRQIIELFVSGDGEKRGGVATGVSVGRRGERAELTIETGTPGILILALARALAEAQGGVLEESLEDGRTTLHVFLPLAP
jgi:signal transduction histidine kinase